MQQYEQIRRLLKEVRGRWRAVRALQAVARLALSLSIVLAVGLLLARLGDRSPIVLTLVGLAAVIAVPVACIWAFAPLRQVPNDAQVARYIEERSPELEDRLATAVDVVRAADSSPVPTLSEPIVADAARRASELDASRIVPRTSLRDGSMRAVVATALLATLAFFSSGPSRRIFDAAVLTVFPARITLHVSPGNAQVKSGSTLGINAQLVGTTARLVAQVEMGDGEHWHTVDMTGDDDGRFRLRLDSVVSPFKYRVLAGSVTSPTYTIEVVNAPRVTRIDLDYTYPAARGGKSRRDEDGGDIYAPTGTIVRLHVHTDKPAPIAVMVLDQGQRILLDQESAGVVTGKLTLTSDGSYRIGLAGADGLTSNGDVEYFIRVLEHRPADVRVLTPGADRTATPLDSVPIEAQAEDETGIDRFELVYAVRGGDELAMPLATSGPPTRLKGHAVLPLKSLGVGPGDFISYYVRARQVGEAAAVPASRSDIYFIDVRPPVETPAGGPNRESTQTTSSRANAVDGLVAAQRQIIVATWKLDRRADAAGRPRSEQDVRALASGESDLRGRVEQLSNVIHEAATEDARRAAQTTAAPKEPEALPEEAELIGAASAMDRAVTSLEQLKTVAALSPEMQSLDHLLKAKALVARRDVEQSGTAGGKRNRNDDLSTLFDRELQKSEQTNSESRATTERQNESTRADAEKLKALAARQDDLLKRQQAIARNHDNLSEDALKRELEALADEQADLRQRLEEIERQEAAAGPSGDAVERMREAADEMRAAAEALRGENPEQASADSRRALDALKELEQKMQASRPDRRPAGPLEAAARLLADGQRQVAGEVSTLGQTVTDKQATQWLATEQEQLASRLRDLEQRLKQTSFAEQKKAPAKALAAVASAAQDLDRQRLAERMQKSADDLRTVDNPSGQARLQGEFAQALDRAADTLVLAGNVGAGAAGQSAANELDQVQQLRQTLDRMSRELDQLNQRQKPGQNGNAQQQNGNGPSGQGQEGGAGSASAMDRLRQQYSRDMQQAKDLLSRLKRDDPSFFDGGAGGLTSDGQGMVQSAPGTESFKQDYAKWEQLRQQATHALDVAAASLSDRLPSHEPRERLAAGVSDKAPADYQKRVESYFKALAAPKTP